MIKEYIKGDLLSHKGPIAHGLNCQGKMGSGVAKAIRSKYPHHYEDYIAALNGFFPPSSNLNKGLYIDACFQTKTYPPIVVTQNYQGKPFLYGLLTQINYGYDKKTVYVDYGLIEVAFTQLNKLLANSGETLGIPKIGAGLGGGDWKVIEAIINEVTPDIDIVVYEL